MSLRPCKSADWTFVLAGRSERGPLANNPDVSLGILVTILTATTLELTDNLLFINSYTKKKAAVPHAEWNGSGYGLVQRADQAR